MIDLGYDIKLSNFFAYDAITRNVLHVVLERTIDERAGETIKSHTIYFEPSFKDQANGFLDLIDKYGWSNLAIIYDRDPRNVELAETFKSMYDKDTMVLKDEVVLDGDDKDLPKNLSQRIHSTTKDSGARVLLVFTNSVLAAQLLYTGDESVMGGSGYAWLLNSSAMIDIGLNSEMSHSDRPSEGFGVLRSGVLGFRERDIVYRSQNPFSSYFDLITMVAQYAESVSYRLDGPGSISGADIRSYILGQPVTPTLPFSP